MPALLGGPAQAEDDRYRHLQSRFALVYERGTTAEGIPSAIPLEVAENLARIASLPPGWNSYDAPAFSPQVVSLAWGLVGHLYSFAEYLSLHLVEPSAVAAGDASVGLVWKDDVSGAEVEVYVSDLGVEFAAMRGGETVEGSIDSIQHLLTILRERGLAF